MDSITSNELSDSDLEALLEPVAMEMTGFTLPTQRQELDRKLAGTLDWLISQHKNGAIGNEALSIASDALFMAVSGLVDDDLVGVITAMGSYLPSNKPSPQSKFFTRKADGFMLVVSWTPGDEFVVFRKGDGSKSVRKCADASAAREMYANVKYTLEKASYEEEK